MEIQFFLSFTANIYQKQIVNEIIRFTKKNLDAKNNEMFLSIIRFELYDSYVTICDRKKHIDEWCKNPKGTKLYDDNVL